MRFPPIVGGAHAERRDSQACQGFRMAHAAPIGNSMARPKIAPALARL